MQNLWSNKVVPKQVREIDKDISTDIQIIQTLVWAQPRSSRTTITGQMRK